MASATIEPSSIHAEPASRVGIHREAVARARWAISSGKG